MPQPGSQQVCGLWSPLRVGASSDLARCHSFPFFSRAQLAQSKPQKVSNSLPSLPTVGRAGLDSQLACPVGYSLSTLHPWLGVGCRSWHQGECGELRVELEAAARSRHHARLRVCPCCLLRCELHCGLHCGLHSSLLSGPLETRVTPPPSLIQMCGGKAEAQLSCRRHRHRWGAPLLPIPTLAQLPFLLPPARLCLHPGPGPCHGPPTVHLCTQRFPQQDSPALRGAPAR